MNLWEVIIVSFGLALDSFTIAVCKGSTQGKLKRSTVTIVGLIFGAIQTIMLAAGMIVAIYPMLNIQNEKIISMNQWFSAIILIYLGIKFFKNAFKANSLNERREEFFGYKGSMGLALATSLDAFILGIGFGLLRTEIISNILRIQGYKVGKFISPHLIKYNERISINNKLISDEEMSSLIEELKPKIELYNKKENNK